jgi:hypothetical protein
VNDLAETELNTEYGRLMDTINGIEGHIADDRMQEVGLLFIREGKVFKKRWEDHMEPLRKSAWENYQVVQTRIKSISSPLEEKINLVSLKCNAYDTAKRRAAQEAAEKAAAEARQKAQEAAAAAEAAALTAKKTGAPVPIPAPVTPPPPPPPSAAAVQVDGLSRRVGWKAEVYDLGALIAAVAANTPGIPINALQANLAVLNDLARACQGVLKIPGVRAVEEVSFVRGRR